ITVSLLICVHTLVRIPASSTSAVTAVADGLYDCVLRIEGCCSRLPGCETLTQSLSTWLLSVPDHSPQTEHLPVCLRARQTGCSLRLDRLVAKRGKTCCSA
ncbi:hypothetical protein KUCAC02_031635, partial [Chaenocephalus aceratus]